jgi:hypothetical protein
MPAMITVRRQVVDVAVEGTESDGMALHRRLPEVCSDVLAPALESAFAPVDPGDAHLVIERLAIDVSDISLDRLDAELADAVRREVAEYFRRHPVPYDATEGDVADEVHRLTTAETVDEALVIFLRTGRLPWSFRVPPGSTLEQLVLEAWGAADGGRGPPPATRARLWELLALPSARARLVIQFTPEFVAVVIQSIAPAVAAIADEMIAALEELPSPARRAAFAQRVWEAALAAGLAGRRPDADELAHAAWAASSVADREDRSFAAFVERRWTAAAVQYEASPRAREADEASPPEPSPSEELADEPSGILVDNAGVVLVHPFLPRFFEGLGLATADELVEPGRAVCLLHHLATGELTAPEHHLALAKVLCGMRLDEPTEADAGLTEAETEETTALLDAAIGHWRALGGSSPDALRAEFLTRPGALETDPEGDWLLRVESRSVDLLLDQLPWGLSLVKLPWMRRLLRVEWR